VRPGQAYWGVTATGAVFVILTLSVDIAKDTLGMLALTTDIAVVVVTVGGIGRSCSATNTQWPISRRTGRNYGLVALFTS
jgi:hypothetical protein